MKLYAVGTFRRILGPAVAAALCILLLLFSQAAKNGARQGLAYCGELVVPSLFAFMCVCQWIAVSGDADVLTRLFFRPFRWLLGTYAPAGTALLLCCLGGYPMGASVLVHQNTQKESLSRLSLILFCPSPAFIIVGIGGLLGSVTAGVVLYGGALLSQTVTAILVSRLFPVCEGAAQESPKERQNLAVAIAESSVRCLTLCGAVVFAAALQEMAEQLPLSLWVKELLPPLFEVTGGCVKLISDGVSLPLVGAAVSFGGLCTHLQIFGILGKNAPHFLLYESVRLFQGTLCYLVLSAFCRFFPMAISTVAFGADPVSAPISPLPAVALLLTVGVYLSWLNREVLP